MPSQTRSAPIEKNDFTGLTKSGKRKSSGRGAPSATSMSAKGGTASGTSLACASRDRYLCWQIRVTSGDGSGKAEPLGDGGGKRRARVVVGADHGGKLDAGDLGENGIDLVERIGGEVLAVAAIADQVFEAGAGVIVKEIFDAGRGKQRQFAIVAMGGADDEDGPVGFGLAPRVWRGPHHLQLAPWALPLPARAAIF